MGRKVDFVLQVILMQCLYLIMHLGFFSTKVSLDIQSRLYLEIIQKVLDYLQNRVYILGRCPHQ